VDKQEEEEEEEENSEGDNDQELKPESQGVDAGVVISERAVIHAIRSSSRRRKETQVRGDETSSGSSARRGGRSKHVT
jgi:hypothetical protein